MAKAGLTIGAILGVFLAIIIISLPSGTEDLENMPLPNQTGSNTDYRDKMGDYLSVFFASVAICAVIGAIIEEGGKAAISWL